MYMLVSVAGARDGKWAWLVSHGGCGLSTRLATPKYMYVTGIVIPSH